LEESDSEEKEEEEEEEGTDLSIMAESVSAFPKRRWPHQPGWWLGLLPASLTEASGPALPWLWRQEVLGAGTHPVPMSPSLRSAWTWGKRRNTRPGSAR